MSIPRLNADIRLVDFNGSEHVPVLAAGRRGTDTVTKLPGGFLRGPKVARQLDAGNPIQTGEHKIHDGDPDPAAQWRVMHYRACFHGKVAPAVMARIRLGPTFHAFRNMCRIAMCATTNQASAAVSSDANSSRNRESVMPSRGRLASSKRTIDCRLRSVRTRNWPISYDNLCRMWVFCS